MCVGRQVYTQVSSSAIGGALDLNQNPPSFIFLQEKLSVQSFSTKAPAKGWRLLFAVDIHFHSTESYPILCNLGELK